MMAGGHGAAQERGHAVTGGIVHDQLDGLGLR